MGSFRILLSVRKNKVRKEKGEGDDGDEMKQKVGGKPARGGEVWEISIVPRGIPKARQKHGDKVIPMPRPSKGDTGATQEQVAALAAFSMPLTHR